MRFAWSYPSGDCHEVGWDAVESWHQTVTRARWSGGFRVFPLAPSVHLVHGNIAAD